LSGSDEAAVVSTSSAAAAVAGMSLDKFMARHTSEDNASFNEILETSNKRRRISKPWLFEDKNKVRSSEVMLPWMMLRHIFNLPSHADHVPFALSCWPLQVEALPDTRDAQAH
jgi:hypothetical protein